MNFRKYYILFWVIFIHFRVSAQKSPDILFGELFKEVQLNHVFKDSKTFPDCIPIFSSERILSDYEAQKNSDTFDLKRFVLTHFLLPVNYDQQYQSDTSLTVEAHIEKLWPILTRQADTIRNASLLPLPNPYIVPGGRFREVYYWDSYFTMLGLRESGKLEMMQHMTDNFSYLINTYGFIPNGNRTYYLSRSQPPFFSLMVKLLEETSKENKLKQYLTSLEKEYRFWMNGTDSLTQERISYRRVVRMPDGNILNRYWDDCPDPRPESYREDVALCSLSNRPSEELYRNIRAACESGWDFSSRWLADEKNLLTIHTIDIIPVDLNCLLYDLEITLSKAYQQCEDREKSNFYKKKARIRKVAILNYCWNKNSNFFHDYDFRSDKSTNVKSLAAVYPLFFQLCSKKQAESVRNELMKNFLKEGGLVTTVNKTGEQWDAPNGWAPLQYICTNGFQAYGFSKDAQDVSNSWKSLNERVFKTTGKMLEKYNVADTNLKGGGGEYPLQDGFGWTNGVFLYFLNNMN